MKGSLSVAGAANRPFRALRSANVLASPRVLSFSAFSIALASAFAVALWATRPSFGAKFGPIDDHEPLIWMGPDGHLPWSQFWTTLMHTEVGAWGGSGRFRPSYYVVRIAETSLFGPNPWDWYAAVLVMFVIACAVFGYTAAIWFSVAVRGTSASVSRSVTLVAAAVCSFLFAGMYTWEGVVGRLGPAELLTLFGTAFVLLSLTKLSLGLGRLWWIPGLLGVTIAIFAKESFVSFALAFPLVGAFSYREFGRRKIDLVCGVLALVPVLVLGLILGPDLLHSQHDVYGTGLGGSRLSGAVSALAHRPLLYPLAAGAVAVLALLAMTMTLRRSERRVAVFLLAVIAWLFVCIFLDAWFYRGQYTVPRYRAIVDLTTTMMSIGAVCFAVVGIRRSRGDSRSVRRVAAASIVVTWLVLAGVAMASVVHIRATHANAAAHAAATKDFQQGLSAALARLAKQPTKTVAVVATYYGDYEPAYAVLNELGRRTDYRIGEYLIVEHYAHGINPLLDQMEQISEQGAPAWRNRPLRGLPARGGAMCVFLNQDPVPLKGCRPGAGLRIVAVGT